MILWITLSALSAILWTAVVYVLTHWGAWVCSIVRIARRPDLEVQRSDGTIYRQWRGSVDLFIGRSYYETEQTVRILRAANQEDQE